MFSMSLLIMAILILMLNLMLNMPQTDKTNFKMKNQFECGFNHFVGMRPSFSNQFFTIGILFLIFDLEISLLLPCFKSESGSAILSSMVAFIFTFLTYFFIMEWKNGGINWSK